MFLDKTFWHILLRNDILFLKHVRIKHDSSLLFSTHTVIKYNPMIQIRYTKHQVILDNVYKHLNTYLMIHYKHDAYNRHIYFV